jgi:Haemolysin secretion/activation protein ShlB/FhaC/HecB
VSRYCTVLTIKDGATVRVTDASVLAPAGRTYPVGSKETLDAFLDDALKKLQKPYRLTLTADELAKDDAGTLPDVDGLLLKMRRFEGSIQDYFDVLVQWCMKKGSACVTEPGVILSEVGLYKVLFTLQEAPLLFTSETGVFRPESGSVEFTVPPPIDLQAGDLRISNLAPPAAAKRVRQLLDRLDGLRGSLWRRAVVIERIRGFYGDLGLDPDVRVSFDTPRPSISIQEGTSILGIAFPFGLPANQKTASADPDWAKVDKSLYSILSDRNFRGYLARKTVVRQKLGAAPAPVLSFADDLGIERNMSPLLNRVRLPIQQLLLQQNGFALSVTSPLRAVENGDEFSFAFWRLEDLHDEPAKPGAVPTAPAPADALGRIDPHAAELSPQPSFAERPPVREPDAPAYCDVPRFREKNTFLGGGAEYRPGQGVRWFGLVQQSNTRLPFGDMNLAAQAGQGGVGTPLVTGSVAFDYVFFERVHRRLAFVANSGVDSSPNRVLGGQTLDEQRSGGTLRGELELFRDRSGHLLKVFAEGRWQQVSHSSGDTEVRTARLNTVDVGASHLYQSTDTPYPWTLRLEPLLRVAFATDDVQAFTRASITARFHRLLPRGFAAEVGGQLAAASANTPDFEQSSIGGSDSVRGFRRDDALGQRAWWMQSELWTPVPLAKADFVRKSVKLAGFVDVGGASIDDGASESSVLRGAGPGVRVLYGPVVFRADWAHGWGLAATGASRNHFYFTVTTNLPL